MSEQLQSLKKQTRDSRGDNMIAGLRKNDLREQDAIFQEDAIERTIPVNGQLLKPPVSKI
jgi:hypothetical protein